MAYGGKGVARVDGKVYFVADSVPGDVLIATATSDSSRYGEAEVKTLLEPSPLRGKAPCAVALACGGCQWMGIDYRQQLEWKQSFISSALTRIGKLSAELNIEMMAAPQAYHYRNRVLLRLHLTQDGKLTLGYFKRGTRELVAISDCAIAAPALNDFIIALQATPWDHLPALKLRLECQEIIATGSGNLVITLHPGEGPRSGVEAFAARLAQFSQVHWVGLGTAMEAAPSVLFDHDLERSFLTLPGQFQQVNMALNRTLRRLVQDHVQATKPGRILDVCCGSGNLSLPLADGIRYIEGVEASKKAIQIARANVDANLLTNVRYLTGDAEKHLWACDRNQDPFDLVVLDPPRQGLHKGMAPLKNMAPKHIIYVSCDPTTLARDLGYLCRNDGYQLTRVVGLDFFPNTYHVETVAFLERC